MKVCSLIGNLRSYSWVRNDFGRERNTSPLELGIPVGILLRIGDGRLPTKGSKLSQGPSSRLSLVCFANKLSLLEIPEDLQEKYM